MKRICLIAVFTCQSVVLAQNKVLSLNGENDSCLIGIQSTIFLRPKSRLNFG